MQSDYYKPIPREFYTRNDVVQIAHELLGKVVYTSFENEITSGIIIETEAYAGITDKASHAFNNRRTSRTEIMFHNGGYSYVYLCYGIHTLFNIVTSVESNPHAVLIRGIEPLNGIELMRKRKNTPTSINKIGIGPGNISKLLGIQVIHTGIDLCLDPIEKSEIWLQDQGIRVPDNEIIKGPRIGIAYAEEDAQLPYRFRWKKSKKAP